MDTKDLRGLMEAYSEVHAPQEVGEEMKPLPKEKMERQAQRAYGKEVRAAAAGDEEETNKQMQRRIAMQSPTSRRNALQNKKMAEEFDIFDVVLEFLQAEGFAETLEEAEWMMANILDEEAIEIILGEGHGSRRSFKTQSGEERRRVSMFGKNYEPHKNYDPEANRGQGQILRPNQAEKQRRKGLAKAAMGEEYMDEAQDATPPKGQSKYGRKAPAGYMQTRKPTLQQMSSREKQAWRDRGIGEEYMDEAQAARENPEKAKDEYEKKYGHVRGEKTPMPPRGDKRREDFEKWYAANVR